MIDAKWGIFGIVVSRSPKNAFPSILFLIMAASCFAGTILNVTKFYRPNSFPVFYIITSLGLKNHTLCRLLTTRIQVANSTLSLSSCEDFHKAYCKGNCANTCCMRFLANMTVLVLHLFLVSTNVDMYFGSWIQKFNIDAYYSGLHKITTGKCVFLEDYYLQKLHLERFFEATIQALKYIQLLELSTLVC